MGLPPTQGAGSLTEGKLHSKASDQRHHHCLGIFTGAMNSGSCCRRCLSVSGYRTQPPCLSTRVSKSTFVSKKGCQKHLIPNGPSPGTLKQGPELRGPEQTWVPTSSRQALRRTRAVFPLQSPPHQHAGSSVSTPSTPQGLYFKLQCQPSVCGLQTKPQQPFAEEIN